MLVPVFPVLLKSKSCAGKRRQRRKDSAKRPKRRNEDGEKKRPKSAPELKKNADGKKRRGVFATRRDAELTKKNADGKRKSVNGNLQKRSVARKKKKQRLA